LFNQAFSDYVLYQSGVATSGHENTRLKDGIPAMWERPENFVPGALAWLAMAEAAAVRTRAGINANELDLNEEYTQLGTALQNAMSEAKRVGGKVQFKLPSAVQLLENAAKKKGWRIVYDDEGNPRRVDKGKK
jgi:hypothetical protein